jgi:hypothetical protein
VADIAVATLDIPAASIVNAVSERLSGLSGEESGGIRG